MDTDPSPDLIIQSDSHCQYCGASLPAEANFCSACGTSRQKPTELQNEEAVQASSPAKAFSSGFRAGLTGSPLRPKRANPYPYGGLIWVVVLALSLVMFKLGMFDDLLQWISSKLSWSSIEMRVEITESPYASNAKFGYIKITNLSDQTITIRKVSVNHRKEAGCSFGSEAAGLNNSVVLEQGHDITFGTMGLLLGVCGTIFIVTVETDKGSEEFNINWR